MGVTDEPVITVGASTDGSPLQCSASSETETQIYHDVWYSWSPTSYQGNDNFLVRVTLSSFDGILAAFLDNNGKGCSAFEANLIGCAETTGQRRRGESGQSGSDSPVIQSEMSTSLTALFRSDSDYLFRIGATSPDTFGEGELSIEYLAGAGFDPEFVGFNGERFEVQGSHDGVFNVLSDEDMQFNVRYGDPGCHHDRTVVAEAGIKYKGHTIHIHPREGLVLDGYRVKTGEQYMIGEERDAWVSVERHSAFPVFVVQTPKYTVHLDAQLPNCERSSTLRLDFTLALNDGSQRPEGLLGATMSRSSRAVRSLEEIAEYRVARADLFSDDFNHNRYLSGRLDSRDIEAFGAPRKRMASRAEMNQARHRATNWLDVALGDFDKKQ